MSDGIIGLFKVMLIVQLFFGFCMTVVTYVTPTPALVYLTDYTNVASKIDINKTSYDIKTGLERQTNIPVVEVGALVFYSGNMLIDLLLNSLFAIPEMVGLLISGIFAIINMDVMLSVMLLTFIQITISIFYFIGLIQLLSGIRSGVLV